MRDLQTLRRELDGIDRELLSLFERRMALCGELAAYKKAKGLPILDSAREEEKLRAVREQSGEELSDYAAALFRELMALSRERQRELAERESAE